LAVSSHGGNKRPRENILTMHDLLPYRDVIMLLTSIGHCIVWDAWRGIIFIGAGKYTDRFLDGAILVEEADRDPTHVYAKTGMTLTKHLEQKFGIHQINSAHVLKVHSKLVVSTSHL